MTSSDPLVIAAQTLQDALYRVDRENDSVRSDIHSDDERDAFEKAIAQQFPFGLPLQEVSFKAQAWTEHCAGVMESRPTVFALVAEELDADADELVARANREQPGEDADKVYRQDQNGGLGGEPGRVGGIFTPTVLAQLAAVARAVDGGDIAQVREAFGEFCVDYRRARKNSRT